MRPPSGGVERTRRAPELTVRSVRPILNVSDLRESLAWFEQLGERPDGHTFRVGAFIGG